MPNSRTKASMRPVVFGMMLAIWIAGQPDFAPAQEAVRPPAPEASLRLLQPLPPDRRTSHSIVVHGQPVTFSATAGSIPITSADGRLLADMGFFAYTRDTSDAARRPVIFAFNGGPGSSSVWLHLGAMGPWRVPLTVNTMLAKGPPPLVDNQETWLEHGDLVFLDPPGTGFSRIAPSAQSVAQRVPIRQGGEGIDARASATREAGGPEWFWSIGGDIATFSEAITAWLRRNNRQSSPVILVGESYGGFRAPLIARSLERDHRVAVQALVLVSPVLDFDGRRGGHLPQFHTSLLPSLAATRLERSGTLPTRDLLAPAEGYARHDYLADLTRGPADEAAVWRMGARVAEITGMMAEHVRYLHGRVTPRAFIEDNGLFAGQRVSLYDAGMADIPGGRSSGRGRGDFFTTALDQPLETAMGKVVEHLGWSTARPYVLMSSEATANWIWRNSPHAPESLSTLQWLLQSHPRMRVLLTHGFTDLVTPYFASAKQLALITTPGIAPRIAFEVYPGGHMFYSRDGSRSRFLADAERLLRGNREIGGGQDQTMRRETP